MLNNFLQKVVILLAAILFSVPINVLAEFIPPGEVSIKTDHYLPAIKNFETGVYKYDVSWQGIPVAESQIFIRKQTTGEKALYDVAAECNTNSAISLFFRMHHISESIFDVAVEVLQTYLLVLF